MSFEKFGVVSYTKDTKTEAFVDALSKGQVMGTRCKQCGTHQFPPQIDCPNCIHGEMEWFEVTGQGRLITYTVVNYGPVGFEDKAPYIIGVGAFEKGIQILANMSRETPPNEVSIGMPIRVVSAILPDDKVTLEFKPAL